MIRLWDRVAREPVLLGAAVIAWFEALDPGASAGVKIAVGATVALVQRMFSTSRKTADENADGARWAGAVEERAKDPAPIVVDEPTSGA